jgi:hypothetical protein
MPDYVVDILVYMRTLPGTAKEIRISNIHHVEGGLEFDAAACEIYDALRPQTHIIPIVHQYRSLRDFVLIRDKGTLYHFTEAGITLINGDVYGADEYRRTTNLTIIYTPYKHIEEQLIPLSIFMCKPVARLLVSYTLCNSHGSIKEDDPVAAMLRIVMDEYGLSIKAK